MSDTIIVGLAIASILVLLVLTIAVFGLRGQVSKLVEAADNQQSRPQPRTEHGNQPLLEEIGKAVLTTNDQIERFDIVFSDIQARLLVISNAVKDLRVGQTATTSSPIKHEPVVRSEPVVVPPERVAPVFAPVPSVTAAPPIEPSREEPPHQPPQYGDNPNSLSRPGGGAQTQLDEYRQLIAEPRKNEINRWADEHGGISCVINDDGSISPLPRDAGALLVLLPDADGSFLLVPGGRLVVEFATSFASMMSIRNVTRDYFELIGDGTGVLRLTEPAQLKADQERWTLVTPGKLSGFTA